MRQGKTMHHPTASEIRSAMLERARAFKAASDWSWSKIGLEAVNDSKFFVRIEGGSNFNVDTYQRVMDWLDRAEREIAA